jgi:phage-related protein (TIGR01555 family)
MRMFDGLRNLVAGLGTSRDKGGQAEYTQPVYDPLQLLTAYRASSLVRRVVDLPAEDACREWREWQAEAEQITAIEAEEARLGLQGKMLEARRQARLFGGAALLIGTGDADPMQPLRPDTIKRAGLKYLTVLTFSDMTAGDIERDPSSPNFGRPKHWHMTTVAGGNLLIHPSRLVILHGIPPMTGLGIESLSGWGESVLLGMLDAIKRVDEVAGNILSLVYEAKIDVVKIPDLMMNLQQRGTEYEAEVIRRMTLAATGKGINGTLILDALEEYEQKSAGFSALPETLDRFMQLASAASGIPMTLLFGMSAGGLNATGESDVRGYYDRVKVQQTLQMQPAMALLDECLIRSALGERPETIHYTWRPLWQATAKERAETGKTLADAMRVVWETETVPPEAIGKALVNGLTECGAFPGFEGYVGEAFGEGGEE